VSPARNPLAREWTLAAIRSWDVRKFLEAAENYVLLVD